MTSKGQITIPRQVRFPIVIALDTNMLLPMLPTGCTPFLCNGFRGSRRGQRERGWSHRDSDIRLSFAERKRRESR